MAPAHTTGASPFTYESPAAAPTADRLTSPQGPTAGGTTGTVAGNGFQPGETSVTVAGNGFQPGETSVTVAGNGFQPGETSVTVTSPTSLTFTTPAHPAGQVPVTVTTPAGTSGTLPFAYVGDAMNSGPENNGRGGTGTVLAATGSPTGPLLDLAVLLLTAGCAFLLFSRRPVIGRHRR